VLERAISTRVRAAPACCDQDAKEAMPISKQNRAPAATLGAGPTGAMPAVELVQNEST
jgi:hypothetical protein